MDENVKKEIAESIKRIKKELWYVFLKASIYSVIIFFGSAFITTLTGNPIYGLIFIVCMWAGFLYYHFKEEKMRKRQQYQKLLDECKTPEGRFG